LSLTRCLRGLLPSLVAFAPAAVLITGPAAASPVANAPGRGPLQRVVASTSTNWSGYSSRAGPFTSVSASWVQPAGQCGAGASYSSFWVGLDGDGTDTVEQTGSEVDCAHGVPDYYTWYEMYPAAPHNYANPVQPGDHFSASVTASGSTFTMTISDATEGWSHTTVKSLPRAKKQSAEVIAEAPCCTLGGGILPLTNFGTVTFNNAMANGSALGASTPARINMVTTSGTTKASTSALRNGKTFHVAWKHS
jgi:hypothetical protein